MHAFSNNVSSYLFLQNLNKGKIPNNLFNKKAF